MLFYIIQTQGNWVHPLVHLSRRLSQLWVPQGGGWVLKLSWGLVPWDSWVSLVVQNAHVHFHVNPSPFPPSKGPENMHVIVTILMIGKIKPSQPLGHIQEVHMKRAPISLSTFSLRTSKTLKGWDQGRVILVIIDGETEANATWDISFTVIFCSFH